MKKTPDTRRGTDRPAEPAKAPIDSPIGTTHDPNSATTDTEVEPTDRFPPKT